ncbi:hypothetical protein Tco_1548541 [Tanacetum coccineum]
MVACLERTDGNVNFHEIVDFLTTSPIRYALIVSLTIYASYIEQFWNTAHSQTVNDVKQIHATSCWQEVVISESSVRSDLHFNDEDGDRPRCHEAMGVSLIRLDKEVVCYSFKKLINMVMSLEDELKFQKSKSKRRRLTFVTSEDEEDLVVEDPSKQGRSLIEEMDLDAGISLVSLHVEVQGRYGQNLETQEGFGEDQDSKVFGSILNTEGLI